MSSKKWLMVIILSALIFRFVGLNWGQGYFFHPDENNMATAVSGLSIGDLHPHFFAYGQFPLYLAFFSLFPITGDHPSFPASILALRFWSVIFSFLFLYFAFLLSKELFSPNSSSTAPKFYSSKIFLVLLIFTPGLIQVAHFGTTESILCLVFIANLYYSLKILKLPHLKYFILAALFTGIGLGSKITTVFFILPLLITAILCKKILYFFTYFLISLYLFLLFSPYNWIDFSAFLSTINYETTIATGATSVFYTRQFFNTTPYLFQFVKVFPYTSGLPVFIFAIFGLYIFIHKSYILNHKSRKNWFIILFSSFAYFLYFGSLFTKWTRFMAPLFFLFPLFATYFFHHLIKLRSDIYYLLIFICCLPGFIFWLNYLRPDIRLVAATDVNHHLPPGSSILSESGNVFPLPLSVDFHVTDFDFYSLDNNFDSQKKLKELITTSDYILVPSRRVFKNQSTSLFPDSAKYYEKLFNGTLGFQLEKIYSPLDFLLNSESAEETFSVFDHPTLRLFKKISP